jgi:asparagine synthase (glutamine-hydrolysing)
MCGIAGHVAFPHADTEVVRKMADALRHRGPDGEGFYSNGPVALGHRRLAIIDVAGGAQPMFNEDRTLAIVFNGEIYNYRELRDEIGPRHVLSTESDTEVLLHLYEDLGEQMLSKLRGMFAFAIWDGRRQRLFAARDPFGEKPFLYAETPRGFFFASEMAAFVAGKVDVGEVDPGALSDFLELLYIPAPHSVFSRVKKLPAGHLLVADRHGTTTARYFEPPAPGSSSRAPDPDAVRRSLVEAVRLQLRSDVPVAALLSGGLDSSAVVALMARELGPGVQTFSIGFGHEDDELPFAKLVADQYRTQHHEILVTEDLTTQVARTFATYSEPFGDSSAVPSVAVARAVSKHVKVVLTGDGGDELFAGYDRYQRLTALPHLPTRRLAALVERLPPGRKRARARRLFAAAGTRGRERHRAVVEVFSLAERKRLLGAGARIAALGPDSGHSDVDVALAFDLTTSLPDDMLVKTDIASMHASLESRCPLLDKAVAALAIPPESRLKYAGPRGSKLIFRAAIADLLPRTILSRPKRGFGSPVARWLSGPLRPMFRDLLGSPNARIRSWLDGKEIDRIVDQTVRGRCNAQQGWLLLTLEGWASAQAQARS